MVSRQMEEEELKVVRGERVVDISCKNCKHLPVCWIVVSLKGAVDNHGQSMELEEKVLDVFRLAEICPNYGSPGIVVIDESTRSNGRR